MILKSLRLEHGLSQQSLCEQIDVPLSVYARYEREERCPSTDTVVKIAQFYGISIESLLELPEGNKLEYSAKVQDLISAAINAEDFAIEDTIIFLNRHQKDMITRRIRKEDLK